jgi:periplasmic protein TonB
MDEAAWAGIRTIVVPTGIAPVQRRSPVPYRKRTPLRKHPDGEPTSRAGGREWFTERVFVEKQQGHKRAGYMAAIAVHVMIAIVLTMVVLRAAEPPPIVKQRSSLVFPVALRMPVIEVARPTSSTAEPGTPLAKRAQPSNTNAPELPAARGTPPPIAPPPDVTPATSDKPDVDGTLGGVDGGVKDGVATRDGGGGGVPDGSDAGSGEARDSQPASSAAPSQPIRGVKSPRKIKDVKPVYPAGAVAARAHGLIIIEATIGPDGKVKDARILRSVPLLDQAALDAVRQWEFEPTMLNGMPVAVILTVTVNFGLL